MDKARRLQELSAIGGWIDENDEIEKDFIILGDMNIEDAEELASATPAGFLSLNDECRPTNTNVRSPKPYDHVMFQPRFTGEIDLQADMMVVNLIDRMKGHWGLDEPYPGEPYDHNRFRGYYSDHHPVVFHLVVPERDDD